MTAPYLLVEGGEEGRQRKQAFPSNGYLTDSPWTFLIDTACKCLKGNTFSSSSFILFSGSLIENKDNV